MTIEELIKAFMALFTRDEFVTEPCSCSGWRKCRICEQAAEQRRDRRTVSS